MMTTDSTTITHTSDSSIILRRLIGDTTHGITATTTIRGTPVPGIIRPGIIAQGSSDIHS